MKKLLICIFFTLQQMFILSSQQPYYEGRGLFLLDQELIDDRNNESTQTIDTQKTKNLTSLSKENVVSGSSNDSFSYSNSSTETNTLSKDSTLANFALTPLVIQKKEEKSKTKA